MKKLSLTGIFCAFLLVGCGCTPSTRLHIPSYTPHIETKVTLDYTRLPERSAQIAVVSSDTAKNNSIEFAAKRLAVSKIFVKTGYKVVDTDATYTAIVSYGIGENGMRQGAPDSNVERYIRIEFIDATANSPVARINAISVGKCASMNAVFDTMLEAAFREFPSENGKTISIDTATPDFTCL